MFGRGQSKKKLIFASLMVFCELELFLPITLEEILNYVSTKSLANSVSN